LASATQIKVNQSDLDQTCINAIRVLTIDAVQKANSGHCGLPMAMAPIAYLLYTRFMRHNPKNPKWFGRDRFVLSAGHGSMLLYSLLYLTGYDLSLDDIKQFRQLGSRTPGHPEYGLAPGVETTTGPLGQGFGNAVGMAMAAKHLEARFDRDTSGLFDHRIFGICSDGDLMEGVASEAASIAGHTGLGNLIFLYDDNHVTIDGHTEISFDENVVKRFDAYKWHTQDVADANDLAALSKAIENGIAETSRPSLIRVHSIIGYGSPHKQGTPAAHSNPLGVEEVKLTKEFYKYPVEPPFFVPDEALAQFRECVERGEEQERNWSAKFETYAKKNSALAGEFQTALAKELPKGWDAELPVFTPKDSLATRVSASQAQAAIAKNVWNLFGGSADLNESTFTDVKDGGDFERGHYDGRNPHFGIREHGMCSILNGIALHGGFISYGSSFLCFTDYARPSIRLAALMEQQVVFVFTHDSIGLGEDGPTHQPIEHLASLRAIPHLTVIRPGDANEAVEAWRTIMTHTQGPILLALSRQKVPTLDRTKLAAASGTRRGGYVITETAGRAADIILLGAGSELQLVVEAKVKLEEKGKAVRVVSMPSENIFEKQDQAYRDSVLPPGIRRRLAVEAGATMSWYRWVGLDGDVIGMTTYGASGKGDEVMKHFGFTVDNVVDRALKLLAR
jgi:transketolase